MKRVLLGLLLLFCAVVAGLWVERGRVAGALRTRLEIEVARALGVTCRIADLDIGAFPPRLSLQDAVIGEAPSLVRVARLAVTVDIPASLVEWRPVIDVRVGNTIVDLFALRQVGHPRGESGPGRAALFPFRIRAFDVGPFAMHFPMDHTQGELHVESVSGTLQSARAAWGLNGSVEIDGAELTRTTHRVRLDHVTAAGGVDAGGLYVDAGTVEGEGIAGSIRSTRTAHRHNASVRFDPSLLGVVVDGLALIGGSAQAQGTLDGDLANPAFDGELILEHAAIGEHRVGDLDAHVTRSGTYLRFEEIRLRGVEGGKVTGRVDLDIDKEVPIESDLTWDAVDLERLLTTIGVDVPFKTWLSASTSLEGSLDPLDLQIAGGGILHATQNAPAAAAAEWQASARVRPHELTSQLEVSQSPNRVATRFLLSGHDMSGSIALTAPDLAALSAFLPEPVASLALTGRADGSAAFSGTTEQPELHGDIALQNVTIMGTSIAAARGDFSIAGGTLATKSTVIDTPAGRAELSGAVALGDDARNDWTLTLRDVNTDLALGLVAGFAGLKTPLNGGTLAGTVRVEERWREPTVRADVGARWLRIGSEPLERVEAEVAAQGPNWTLRLRVTHVKNETLTIDGSGRGRAHVDLAIDSTPLQLARWRETGLSGTVSVNGRLSGDPTRVDGSVALFGSELALGGRPIGDATLRGEARAGEWRLQGSALDGGLTLSGTVGPPALLPYALSLRWNAAQLAPLLSTNQSLSVVSSGDLVLRGVLSDPTRPSGELQAERLDIGEEHYQLHASEPIRLGLAGGRMRIESFQLEGPGSRIAARGDVSVGGDVQLDIDGNGDLELLELLNDRVQSARGTFSLSAQVRRAAGREWSLRGRASVREMALDLGLPVVFTETNGNFELTGGHVQIEELRGKAGGGEFFLGGAIDQSGPAVAWRVKEVGLNAPEWLEERLSGEGNVTGTWKVITVSGRLEVLSALYDRDIDVTDLLPWFRQRLAPVPRGEGAAEVRLDLQLHAPGGIYVDNNYVKAEFSADLRLTGTAESPVLAGTVEVLSGEVTYRNREFTVTGGALDFRDRFRINPLLNIEAETQVSTTEGEYLVVITVTGTADNPRVQLSSDDPALTQNDLLALVAAGKTSAQMQRESTGFSAGSILSLLPTGGVESEVRNVTGLDRFEISSERTQDTGIVPRVTIGKDLTDRLRATLSSTLVETYQTVTLEYRLTHRTSLLALWQGQTKSQAGAVGGGAKLRYEFRGSPFSLLSGVFGSSAKGDAE
jgi:autotransporter translocation and assembly factor TamB